MTKPRLKVQAYGMKKKFKLTILIQESNFLNMMKLLMYNVIAYIKRGNVFYSKITYAIGFWIMLIGVYMIFLYV